MNMMLSNLEFADRLEEVRKDSWLPYDVYSILGEAAHRLRLSGVSRDTGVLSLESRLETVERLLNSLLLKDMAEQTRRHKYVNRG